MKAVARHAAGERSGERRRAAFVVAARAADRVGVDDRAGVTEREVLAAHRRQDALVVDAGVGEEDAKRRHGVRRTPLERHQLAGLADAGVAAEVGAARVGDGRRHHAAQGLVRGRDALEEGDARGPERLGVGADVHLADLDEVLGIEELADGDLLPDRPLPRPAELAGRHAFFEVGKAHPPRHPI